MKRTIFVILLSIISVFSIGFKVSANENNDMEGNGTENSPYVIDDISDLQSIKENLNAYYILEDNICVSTDEWVPIGTKENPFFGVFDGNGYAILGLNGFSEEYQYRGLFGYAGTGSVIKNVTVEMDEDISFNIYAKYMNAHIGMIAGRSEGTIHNCCAKGELIGISDLSGASDCGASNVGLICGSSTGEIICCYSQGKVQAGNNGTLSYGYAYAGGVCGSGSPTIKDSYAFAEVSSYAYGGATAFPYAGGICGSYNATIIRCYAVTNISGREPYLDKAGIAPSSGVAPVIHPEIIDCYYEMTYDGEVTTNISNIENMKLASTYRKWDFVNIWCMGEDGYPKLKFLKKDSNGIELRAVSPGKMQKNVSTNVELVFYFSEDICFEKNPIHLYSGKGVEVELSDVVFWGKMIKTKLEKPLEKNTQYYVLIDVDEIVSIEEPYKKFSGITDEQEYSFSTIEIKEEFPSLYVSLEYAKKGVPGFKYDNLEMPPIPSDDIDEYEKELKYWAEKFEIDDVQKCADLKEVLNQNIYIPMYPRDSGNGICLVESENTNFLTLMRDVIFIEQAQKYLNDADEQLKSAKTTEDMKKAYLTYYSYSQQIYKYFEERTNGKTSDFYITTIVPMLYESLLVATENNEGFKLLGNYLELSGQKMLLGDKMQELMGKATYEEYKQNIEYISNYFDLGVALYQAYFNGDKSKVVEFGLDLFKYVGGNSESETVEQVIEFINDFSDVKSALTMSMMLGSSIGGAPLVIELYDELYTSLKDMIKAWYFVSDYYIYFTYPALYDFCFDEDFLPRKEIAIGGLGGMDFRSFVDLYGTSEQIREAYMADKDPVLRVWMEFIEHFSNTEQYIRKDVVSARRELSNYSSMCQYIQSVDVYKMKLDVVKYASSMINKEDTITVMISCPVEVQIYDNKTGLLLESISSETEIVNDNPYISMYLIGDEKETKCFVVDSENYYMKIIPYKQGEMDICITYESGSEINYSNVLLEMEKPYVINTLVESDIKLLNNEGQVVESDENTFVKKISIANSENCMVVNSELKLIADIYPTIYDESDIFWRVSDSTIAEISDESLLTAKTKGEVEVWAISKYDELISDVIKIMVVEDIDNVADLNLKMCMEQFQREEIIIDGITNDLFASVKWYSDNPLVAIMGDDNVLHSFRSGTAIISGNYMDKEIVIEVVVEGYVVDFDSCEGTKTNSLVNVSDGDKILQPLDPEREGYLFEGWYTSKTYDKKWDFEKDIVEDNIILYAKWIERRENDNNNKNVDNVSNIEKENISVDEEKIGQLNSEYEHNDEIKENDETIIQGQDNEEKENQINEVQDCDGEKRNQKDAEKEKNNYIYVFLIGVVILCSVLFLIKNKAKD